MKSTVLKSFRYSLKKNKGFTLVELVVSLAILSIIVSPVLLNILSSVKNNRASEATFFASSMNARAMEDLKSRAPELLSLDNGGTYYEDNRLLVQYSVETSSNYNLPNGNLGTIPAYELEFNVGNSNFEVRDVSGVIGVFDLSSPYSLELKGSQSPYSFALYGVGDTKTLLKEGNVASQNGIVSVHVNVSADRVSSSPKLTLHSTIDNTMPSTENVNFYILGDSTAFNLVNDGYKQFYQFYNANSNSTNFTSTIFKITVIAKKKDSTQKELGRLVSYVGK